MKFEYKEVRTEEEIQDAFAIYASNPEYFEIVSHKVPTRNDVEMDMLTKPDGLAGERKHYGVYCLNGEAVALTDILEGFPEDDVYYIGLFMIKGDKQRRGLGRSLFLQLAETARAKGFERIRLGVVEENQKGLAFWETMGLAQIRTVKAESGTDREGVIFVLEKKLTE